MKRLFAWYIQLFISVDQVLNALLLGFADETLSSRAHRMREKRQPYFWWLATVIDFLFFWQDDHCKAAYELERKRIHLPPEMRE